jgi:hypothetical protein
MALFQHTTKVAVLASLAAGIAVTLASGPLRADRDVNTELLAQVDALARSNERLTERLALQQTQLTDALAQLSALRTAASTTPPSKPSSTSPQTSPLKTAAQAAAEERAAFRARALEALKPELEAIQAQLVNTVPKATYDKHIHEYTTPTVGGWARLDLISANPDYLLPYMPPDKAGQAPLEKTTSRPK